MNGKTRDERLRELLRETDIAQHETPLTAEEVREMRRAALTAVPESRRRLVWSPALAGLALAALAAFAVLMLWPRSEPSQPPAETASKPAAEKPAAPRAPANSRASAGIPFENQAVVLSETTVPERKNPIRPRRPAPIREPEPSAESSPAMEIATAATDEIDRRQVQFSTPGGTRVIWILTSQKAL